MGFLERLGGALQTFGKEAAPAGRQLGNILLTDVLGQRAEGRAAEKLKQQETAKSEVKSLIQQKVAEFGEDAVVQQIAQQTGESPDVVRNFVQHPDRIDAAADQAFLDGLSSTAEGKNVLAATVEAGRAAQPGVPPAPTPIAPAPTNILGAQAPSPAEAAPPEEVSMEGVFGPGARIEGTQLKRFRAGRAEAIAGPQKRLQAFETFLASPEFKAATDKLIAAGGTVADAESLAQTTRARLQKEIQTGERRFGEDIKFQRAAKKIEQDDITIQQGADALTETKGARIAANKLAKARLAVDIAKSRATLAAKSGGRDDRLSALRSLSTTLGAFGTILSSKAAFIFGRIKDPKTGKDIPNPAKDFFRSEVPRIGAMVSILGEDIFNSFKGGGGGPDAARQFNLELQRSGVNTEELFKSLDALGLSADDLGLSPKKTKKLNQDIDNAKKKLGAATGQPGAPSLEPRDAQQVAPTLEAIRSGSADPNKFSPGTLIRFPDDPSKPADFEVSVVGDPSGGNRFQISDLKKAEKTRTRPEFEPVGKTGTEIQQSQADERVKSDAQSQFDTNARDLILKLSKKPLARLTRKEKRFVTDNARAIFGRDVPITNELWEEFRDDAEDLEEFKGIAEESPLFIRLNKLQPIR